MRSFFLPSHAAATPCLMRVKLLSSFALVTEPNPRRPQVSGTGGDWSRLDRCRALCRSVVLLLTANAVFHLRTMLSGEIQSRCYRWQTLRLES